MNFGLHCSLMTIVVLSSHSRGQRLNTPSHTSPDTYRTHPTPIALTRRTHPVAPTPGHAQILSTNEQFPLKLDARRADRSTPGRSAAVPVTTITVPCDRTTAEGAPPCLTRPARPHRRVRHHPSGSRQAAHRPPHPFTHVPVRLVSVRLVPARPIPVRMVPHRRDHAVGGLLPCWPPPPSSVQWWRSPRIP
jgi:hypothetical protein